jgi:integrase
MRVELKGVHTVQRRLASGELALYYYAWRGGPRLRGEPGSPEFIRSYDTAHRTRREPNPSLFRSIIMGFKVSEQFKKLRERTKADYLQQIAKIEIAFGDLPLDALNDPRVTRDFFEWRDAMASSPRQADYGWTVLMRLMSWARDRGLTAYRPPERIDRLYQVDRSDRTWSEVDIDAFVAVASLQLQRALVLALESGQRQGDLLTLPWSAYDGAWIRLRQSKNGRKVNIPVTRLLRATLENTPRTSITILTNALGRPWKANAFRKAWGTASRKAGLSDLTFHDLRGTAVTRLSEAECTPQEIATITGHSLRDVSAILDRYSARTDKLALAAIAKLERGKR